MTYPKGTKVRLTEEGKKLFLSNRVKNRKGIVACNSRTMFVSVRFDGTKSIQQFHPYFIEEYK